MPEMLERSTLEQTNSRNECCLAGMTGNEHHQSACAGCTATWLAILLSYFAVFGGMLVYSDFLPFTFDNNKSLPRTGMPAICTNSASSAVGIA